MPESPEAPTGQAVRSLPGNVVFITPNGPVGIQAEIADEPSEWQQGLMFREHLGENEGMLFVFPAEQVQKFWMKNTLIPLDIIFISAGNRVVDVQTALPCTKDPCTLYVSKEPTQYVVEVNAGFAVQNQVRTGDEVVLGSR